MAFGYPPGMVPEGTLVLTAGVDVQMSTIYFVIRAWGLQWQSWLVRAGRVETWDQLEAELFLTRYPVGAWQESKWEQTGDQPLAVRLACIDARYRKDEVHAFVRRWNDVARAILGRDHLGGNLCTMTLLDKNQAGQAMRSGRKAWHIDTSIFKDRVSRLIHSETGHWSLPAELPPGIVIRSPRCPGCRSRQFRTTKTVRQPRWTVRYHVCTGCGLHFKSIKPEDEK